MQTTRDGSGWFSFSIQFGEDAGNGGVVDFQSYGGDGSSSLTSGDGFGPLTNGDGVSPDDRNRDGDGPDLPTFS